MTSTISKYFTGKGGGKRKQSSSSSVSDLCASPEGDSDKTKQDKKKQRKESENSTDEDMALQDTLQEIKVTMAKLATKEDIQQLREEMERLTTSLTTRIERMETCVFELENEKDKLKDEVSKLRGEKTELEGQLAKHTKEADNLKRDLNDHEQHGRQWNLRVYGVQETRTQESVEDCVNKCVDIFSKKLGVPVSAKDVEIAHRSGKAVVGGSRPRPILARFYSRRQRGLVLTARRKLKQTGISVGEDLTQANYRLLRKVSNHTATMAAWSSNGKILTKLKNGKTLKVEINTDVDTMFLKEMA